MCAIWVCKTDSLKMSVRCLCTADAFQIKRSLTRHLADVHVLSGLCIFIIIPALSILYKLFPPAHLVRWHCLKKRKRSECRGESRWADRINNPHNEIRGVLLPSPPPAAHAPSSVTSAVSVKLKTHLINLYRSQRTLLFLKTCMYSFYEGIWVIHFF